MDIINAIKNSTALMSIILNRLNTGVFIIDEKYRVTSFNSHFSDLIFSSLNLVTNHMCDQIVGCVGANTKEKKLKGNIFCERCDLFKAIEDAIESSLPTNENVLVREHLVNGVPKRKFYRYSIKPLILEGYRVALLMVDDITTLEDHRAELLEQNGLVRRMNNKFQQDLNLAKKVQTSLIPKKPIILNDYYIDFRYFPLEEIGGDMFDVLRISDDKLGIFMCDVIGHGLPAALITTMVKALMATYKIHLHDPSALMSNLNKQLIAMMGEPYMTAFYGVLDTLNHSFEFVRAGHPFPWMLNDGIQTFGHLTNPMLGIDTRYYFETESIGIEDGSKIMLYTDGLLEAGTKDGCYETRLVEFIDEHPRLSGSDLLSLMEEDLKKSIVQDKHMDDVCILMIEHMSKKNKVFDSQNSIA